MKIGKVYPSYVDLSEYRHGDENFYDPNYLAVHSSCETVADTLSDCCNKLLDFCNTFPTLKVLA